MNWFIFQSDVKGTFYSDSSAGGACELPQGDYVVSHAIGLGQQRELNDLRWRQGMCGQVLNISCGGEMVQAIVADKCDGTDCGLNMIIRTWNILTNSSKVGVSNKCSVELSTTNPLKAEGMQCYNSPYSGGNEWFVMLGVMNTQGKISSAAELNGVNGTRTDSHWFSFSAKSKTFAKDDVVTFTFEDDSKQTFKVGDCQSGDPGHVFHWFEW